MAITRAEFPLPDLSEPLTRGYFEGAAAGELRIPWCMGCAEFVWYPEPECPSCGAVPQWRAVSGRARLFSWVVVHRAFLPAFADRVPFVTALVTIEEDPLVRLCSLLVDVDEADLAADMALEAVFRPLEFSTVPGRSVIVPMFRPAARGAPATADVARGAAG